VEISSVVVHKIEKEEGDTGADNVHLIISEAYLDSTNEQIFNIVTTLNASFSDRIVQRAILSDLDFGFKRTVADFNNIDLLSVSQTLCTRLHQQMLGSTLSSAKGGYLVFALYNHMNYDYLGVFFVRKATGSNLEFQDPDNSWDLELVRYLDIKHFAMGARINITTLLADEGSRYLQLVKGNTNISDYFTDWIGVTNPTSESIDAQQLFEIINNIDLNYDQDRDEVKRQVYNYAREQTNRLINIRNLSDYIFGDSEKILNHCEAQQIEISHEFKLKGNALNKFYKITARANGILLQASYDKFNEADIQVLDDETIIITSQELVRIINEQKNRSDDCDD
tara:strand:- start:2218 stop:3231 length:1014 start_codon:yes stop_codon:yes gene_type:complete